MIVCDLKLQITFRGFLLCGFPALSKSDTISVHNFTVCRSRPALQKAAVMCWLNYPPSIRFLFLVMFNP
jgi:hypothetical protein